MRADARRVGALVVDAAPALTILAASRLLVWLSGRFASRHVPVDPTAPWDLASIPDWFRWDALMNLRIASEGYAGELTRNFPLYPLTGALVARLTGLSPAAALLVVANAAFVASGLVVFELARRELGRDAAVIAVASMAFFPSTVFLSVAYPGSLFLLTSALVFHALGSGRFASAAMIAGLASACRPYGALLAVPVTFEAWRCGRRWWRLAALALVSCSGLVAYALYLRVAFGNALDFAAAYHARDATLADLVRPWRFVPALLGRGSRELVINLAGLVALIVISAASSRRISARYTVFAAAVSLLLYWQAAHVLLGSTHRFLAELVPVHIGVAALLARRDLAFAVIAVSAGASVFWTALYVQGYLVR